MRLFDKIRCNQTYIIAEMSANHSGSIEIDSSMKYKTFMTTFKLFSKFLEDSKCSYNEYTSSAFREGQR